MCSVKIHGHIHKQILTYFFNRPLLTFSFPSTKRIYHTHDIIPIHTHTIEHESDSRVIMDGNEVEHPFLLTGPEIT